MSHRRPTGMPPAHGLLVRAALGAFPLTPAVALALILTACSTAPDGSGQKPSGPTGAASRGEFSVPVLTVGTGQPTTTATLTPTALPPPTPPPIPPPTPALTLPGGGTTVFPDRRLVGFSGYPGAPALGRLGVGNLDERGADITALAGEYAAGRRPLPVFELIATVVHSRPGADGLYRTRIDEGVVRRHLEAARRHGAILLLNIQPGRAAFLDEVKHWEPWLREPDVGLALDPEWAVTAGQVPGKVFGRTTGAELDAIAAYVAGIVAPNRLPEKVMVYHQLSRSIVREPSGLQPHPGVTLVVSVDGIGSRAQKAATWRSIVAETPDHVHKGFKLFYDEDAQIGPLMTPAEVLALTPQPEYVLYE